MMYFFILLGSIGGISGPAIQSLISKSASPQEQGTVQGAISALVSLTGIVGPLIGGYIFAQFAKPDVAPWLVGMPFFLGAVLYAFGLVNTYSTFRRIPEAPSGQAKIQMG